MTAILYRGRDTTRDSTNAPLGSFGVLVGAGSIAATGTGTETSSTDYFSATFTAGTAVTFDTLPA